MYRVVPQTKRENGGSVFLKECSLSRGLSDYKSNHYTREHEAWISLTIAYTEITYPRYLTWCQVWISLTIAYTEITYPRYLTWCEVWISLTIAYTEITYPRYLTWCRTIPISITPLCFSSLGWNTYTNKWD